MRWMKWLALVLAGLLVLLQYRLWFGGGGEREVAVLQDRVDQQRRPLPHGQGQQGGEKLLQPGPTHAPSQ